MDLVENDIIPIKFESKKMQGNFYIMKNKYHDLGNWYKVIHQYKKQTCEIFFKENLKNLEIVGGIYNDQ